MTTSNDHLALFESTTEYKALQDELNAVFQSWYADQKAKHHHIEYRQIATTIFGNLPYKIGAEFNVVLADGKTCRGPTIY